MSAPLAFLYRSHAWNSGLEAFCAVVILCVVSCCCRLRTSTAMRSVGLKLSRMYSEADYTAAVGFSGTFMAPPGGPVKLGPTRTLPNLGISFWLRPPLIATSCLVYVEFA